LRCLRINDRALPLPLHPHLLRSTPTRQIRRWQFPHRALSARRVIQTSQFPTQLNSHSQPRILTATLRNLPRPHLLLLCRTRDSLTPRLPRPRLHPQLPVSPSTCRPQWHPSLLRRLLLHLAPCFLRQNQSSGR
jgi:hypothetical protein